ncbi:protein TIFY 5A-like [Syzygium oleosum]|uniref:protein TIFY 5A-like n=1 Tax=Syzygium oleosum TaxID=219896 RepID=UPI0011D244D7|nr:protein TIFY 5A-like [Syzygium oleosum]
MKRSFDLELRLQPYSVSDFLASSSSVSSAESAECSREEQRKLTVFYDGKVSASTVTELQAKAIILLANREMEERSSKTPTGSEPSTPSLRSQPSTPSLRSQPSTPSPQAQVYNSTGLSMKRSLQRFLQKRQHRIQATSPYHHQY